jgi:hypothetical protein
MSPNHHEKVAVTEVAPEGFGGELGTEDCLEEISCKLS